LNEWRIENGTQPTSCLSANFRGLARIFLIICGNQRTNNIRGLIENLATISILFPSKFKKKYFHKKWLPSREKNSQKKWQEN
jgi:hypothetical protein